VYTARHVFASFSPADIWTRRLARDYIGNKDFQSVEA
jgi:hypothetical protein